MINLKIAFKMLILMTIITGFIYPLAITGIGQLIFPDNSNGSMIKKSNKIIGSELIGQGFSKPEFFWGRPSAIANNPMPSGGSNLNPAGKLFKGQFQARVDTIRKYHGNVDINQIPKDLLFSSASGVDPHISPEAAYFQVDRIAKARNFDGSRKAKLINLIQDLTQKPQFGIFGTSLVNVLELNIKLNEL